MSVLGWLSEGARDELRALVANEVAAALAVRDREPTKRWLTAKEAGAYLGCSARAIYRRVDRGRIPAGAVKHQGRRLQIDRFALDRAIEQRP